MALCGTVADVMIYSLWSDQGMAPGARDAGWYTVLDTSGEGGVVDETTQAEFCASMCSTTHAGDGCQAFSATYSADSCTLMAASDAGDLEDAEGTNMYILHGGTCCTCMFALHAVLSC